LTRQEWEKDHNSTGEYAGSFELYDQKEFAVGFDTEGGQGPSNRIYWLDWRRPKSVLADLDVARLQVSRLLPGDAELVKTYSPDGRPEAIVDVHRSATLAELFGPIPFSDTDPATFIVLYKVFDGQVDSWVMARGNNP
jgi:hypothetical protein